MSTVLRNSGSWRGRSRRRRRGRESCRGAGATTTTTTTTTTVALALVAAACGCPVPPPANPIADGAAMAERLDRMAASVGTFRAEARVEQVTERGPVKGHLYAFLRLPDHLRLDSMSPVDTPLAVLVSDGVDFALHDVGANRYYWGRAEPCNIARLVRIPLAAAEVVRILVGLPPRVADAGSTVEWDGDGYYVWRQDLGGGLTLESRIAPVGDDVDTLGARLLDGTGVLWEVSFAERREVDGVRLPGRVRFEARGAAGPVDLRYLEPEVRVDLPDDAWTYPQPEGIPGEEVSCDTAIEPVQWGMQE